MWLKKLKIAVIEKNMDALTALLEDIPLLEDPHEQEEALYLLREATKIYTVARDDIALSMQQMRKNIDFLNSAQAQQSAKFDIRS
jgi:hypothetical protein